MSGDERATAPSRDPDVFLRPGAASIRQAALWDAVYELARQAAAGGGLPIEAIQAMIDASIAAHEGKPDPHPAYLTDAELALKGYLTQAAGDALYVNVTGNEAMAGSLTVQGLGVKLDPRADNTLQWGAGGLYSSASGGGPTEVAHLYRQEWEGPSGATVTLAAVPDTLLTVARNGVEQANGGLHFSQAGNVLTFTDPFDPGERLVITYAAGDGVALEAGAPVPDVTVLERQEFFPAAAATAVTLAFAPTAVLEVSRNGVAQSETAGDYSWVGATVTFSDPFAAGERVLVLYQAGTSVVTDNYWEAPTGTPTLSVQSTAPSAPAVGDLWIW